MESKRLEFNLNGDILFADGKSTVRGKNVSTDGKLATATGDLEVDSIFDTLIDKIERDIRVNELTVCRDNIEIYMKFMSDSKWGDWKLKRVDHANRFSKIVKELSSSKVIELIELGYSRHVLKIDDIVNSLDTLINRLSHTIIKYGDLSTYEITGKITNEGNCLGLRYTPFNMVNSTLRTSFRIDSDTIDDLEHILNKKTILNLTDSGEKYRHIGKTSLLVELCNKKNATLIVSSHHIKKALDIHLSKLGYHVPIKYLGKDVNLEGTKFNYYVDEGISKEQLEKLINQNPNCLGGFVNHESFK